MTEETHADLIACEDALMFVNAAITSTGQREFHHDAGEQRLSLDFLHAYMLANYREVYAAALALDVNDHNAVMIIRNLLAHAAEVGPQRRRIEGRLIARRLELLPPQRVYRLFRQVRRAGINNRRVRDALRIFEIHDGQCGVLVYVADALASAFVVPHPDDYRALHATLVEDLFGELIYHYALLAAPAAPFPVRIDDTAVRSPADLRAQAALRRREWADFHDEVMAAGLFGQMSRYQSVQALHDFELTRFLPSFTPRRENHIGEVITDGDARVAYLKTFRLSETQTRRGYLLTRLAEYDWNLRATAAALGTDEAALALRLERAGFGYLLRQDVLDHFRAQARTPASGQRPAARRR
ncbi:hypothetical protein ABZ801_04625 [Actinomadura sp. NPDC047616]|uniref:ARPP-2 domain-containing protein n=1 Tax=Actinomadura sp. NPDC047616 TaxID=3155914 RepID=UPI003400D17D